MNPQHDGAIGLGASSADFSRRQLPRLGKRVLRLGIAGNYGLATDDIRHAAERGANFWLWSPRFKAVTPALREILASDREHHVVAMLSLAYTTGMVRRGLERALRELDCGYIDIFLLPWLGRMSRLSSTIEDQLSRLKAEGKLRAGGCSIHDRPRAGRLARDSSLDALMIRYNAKHPGAEQDIFPHLEPRRPLVISYTATAWRQLLRPLAKLDSMPPWPGDDSAAPPPLTAGLCYRYCLSNPSVDLVLSGPKDRAQLDENLAALERGPLPDDQLQWVAEYGRRVKQLKKLDFV